MGKVTLLPVLGLVFLLSSCHSFQAPQFKRVQNLRVAKWDFSQPVVAVDVVYYNPNDIGFDFRGAEVDLHLDSLWLGHAVIDTAVHVAPHSEFVITLPIQLDLQRLLQNGLQTYLNRKVDVKVDGTVRGSKAGIIRKFPVHYEGMQELDLKLF
jgi:LEA14-like dessication related protein